MTVEQLSKEWNNVKRCVCVPLWNKYEHILTHSGMDMNDFNQECFIIMANNIAKYNESLAGLNTYCKQVLDRRTVDIIRAQQRDSRRANVGAESIENIMEMPGHLVDSKLIIDDFSNSSSPFSAFRVSSFLKNLNRDGLIYVILTILDIDLDEASQILEWDKKRLNDIKSGVKQIQNKRLLNSKPNGGINHDYN